MDVTPYLTHISFLIGGTYIAFFLLWKDLKKNLPATMVLWAHVISVTFFVSVTGMWGFLSLAVLPLGAYYAAR